MKKKGSKSDFTRQRDRELYAHFMDILSESRGVTLGEMFAMAARRPASRFWVSETRAAIVIGAASGGVSVLNVILKHSVPDNDL